MMSNYLTILTVSLNLLDNNIFLSKEQTLKDADNLLTYRGSSQYFTIAS